MTRIRSTYLAMVAVLLTPMAANAVPLSYDESVDGDISNANFALDFGANIVIGTAGCDLVPVCDFDKFNASLPIGAILDSIELTLTNAVGGNGTFAFIFEVYDPDFNEILYEDVSAGGNFFWAVDLSLSGLQFTGLNSFPTGMRNDYTITMNISAVPEPGTLALLGIGLFGLGLSRRRLKV